MTLLYEAVGFARKAGGEAVLGTFRVDDIHASQMASRHDHGLFGPESMVWRVNGDSSAIIGGFRALLLQAMHARAMALFNEHTDMYTESLDRLGRTVQFVVAVTFGSTAAAQRHMEIVRAVHSRVTGMDRNGDPIAANDPDLLRWVHITLVDSFLESFARFGQGKLTDAESDQYVAEMSVIGEGLGATEVPKTVAELRASMASYKPEFHVSVAGRKSVRFLLNVPGLNPVQRAGYLVVMAGAVGSLPRFAQRQLRLPVLPGADRLAMRPAAMALTRTLGWLLEGARPETNPMY